jgi:hypothetical protein
MKCHINYMGKIEKCVKCGGDLFRLTKSKAKYTNTKKTEGIYRDLKICDNCENRQEFNFIPFKVERVEA